MADAERSRPETRLITPFEKRVLRRAREYVKTMSDEKCPECGAHASRTSEKILLHEAVARLEEQRFPSEAPTARRKRPSKPP